MPDAVPPVSGRFRSSAVRALRWLALVPACLAVLYLFFAGTVATHYLVEQHLCPAAAFDREKIDAWCSSWAELLCDLLDLGGIWRFFLLRRAPKLNLDSEFRN